MHIPAELYKSFRATVAICFMLSLVFWYFLYLELQPKDNLDRIKGVVEFAGKKALPGAMNRLDTVDYVTIKDYKYPFAIYQNENNTAGNIECLNKGDTVTAYYYFNEAGKYLGESNNEPTPNISYLEKDGVLYYKPLPLIKQMAFYVIAILYLFCVACFIAYKKGKLEY